MSPFEPHEGNLELANSFNDAWDVVDSNKGMRLETSTGSPFTVKCSFTSRGPHKGEKTLRFLKGKQEFARAYQCCWGQYYNCNRTRIGMYCRALDKALSDESISQDYPGKGSLNISDINRVTEKDNKHEDDYARIFKLIEKTLFQQSQFSREDLISSFNRFKNIDYRRMSDDEIFWNMVKVIFYSGMKATTVSDMLPKISHYFSDYRKVKEYTKEDLVRISQDSTIIRNRRKIFAISRNAEKFNFLVEQYGSLGKYLESFGPLNEDRTLNLLRYDLRSNFGYLGPRTVYHFMTDLGLNVLKPDRVICRIMYRLGMIRDEKDIDGVIQVGRHMSAITGHPIRYIDIVLVKYGQMGRGDEFGLEDGICLKNNPKCNICGVRQYCNYL